MSFDRRGHMELSPAAKLWQLNWGLMALLLMLTGISVALLYSAANGSFEPWAVRQMARFGVGAAIMIAVAVIDLRFWLRWAYGGYAGALALLILVEFIGATGMGAQRWIDIGVIQLQPSEVMKIALVVALASYFNGIDIEDMGRLRILVPALLLVCAPVALVVKQPDLGTALILVMVGGVMFWLAGVRLWQAGLVATAAIGAVPVAWQFLHQYQKERVLTFINPENDPLGAGYHILQSKIALGSGGLSGKGFMAGTQSHLDFVPEKQTDFIFTMLAEEFGMLGGLTLLGVYLLLVAYGIAIAWRSRNQFGRLLAMGLTTTFFLYVFINVAMVMGLIPVVGVPLPFISYGGTSLLTLMIGFGLIMSVSIHRDLWINRRGGAL